MIIKSSIRTFTMKNPNILEQETSFWVVKLRFPVLFQGLANLSAELVKDACANTK